MRNDRKNLRLAPIWMLIAGLAICSSTGAQTIRTVAGNGSGTYTGDGGPAIEAGTPPPWSVLVIPGASGFYFATESNIRRVDADGVVTPVAGQLGSGGPTTGYAGDGGLATGALFDGISAMALDRDGALFLADHSNGRVRRIDSQGVVTTYAGNGSYGFSDEPGPATERPLELPTALALDYWGVLYIADRASVRKVALDGTMTVVAGTGTPGYNGDGISAAEASLRFPTGLVATPDGILYIADSGNGRIRRVDTSGTITTVARVPALGLSQDVHGNFYYARSDSARIERYLPHFGTIEPVAGTGVHGYGGDGGPALDALIGTVAGLSVEESGDVYIADGDNRRIRRIGSLDADLPKADFYAGSVVEGDSGTVPAQMRIALHSPAPGPVVFEVTTGDRTAVSSHDYQAVASRRHEIPAGGTGLDFDVLVYGDEYVEGSESFDVRVDIISGAVAAHGGYVLSDSVRISDDDEAGPPVFFLRDDREIVPENGGPRYLNVTLNDSVEMQPDGSLEVSVPPSHGTATVQSEQVVYTPAQDWTGEDSFSYRLCEAPGRCLTAVVTLVVRPVEDQYLAVFAHSGRERIAVSDLRQMPGAGFLATPLAPPARLVFELGVDTTPQTPWDGAGGVGWQVRSIPAPADGQARQVRVLAMDSTQFGFNSTLYLGVDADGDMAPDQNELRCMQVEFTRRCELSLDQAAGETVDYWVMLQSRGAEPQQIEVEVFEVPLVEGDGSFAATGPGRLPAGEDFQLTLTWDDPTFLAGQRRVGYVRVQAEAGAATGEFPVILEHSGSEYAPVRLVDGQTRRLALAGGHTHRRIFVDVPVGSTRLSLSSRSEANVDIYLMPVALPIGAGTAIPAVSESLAPVAAGEGATGNEEVVVQESLLQPARWYVVAVNRDGEDAALELTAEIQAVAPQLRPGSYFNEARSGHGLFLYPAGAEWAGLWYTYREDRTPTWYYLQAPAPTQGGNGLWTAPIYRASWNGASNSLTQVGTATVTPTGPDAFRFSYSVDGLAGSEPMAALGRGCPSLGGVPQDLSSHWFDPANAGTGYSVQMLPNYEFLAAFVYDGLGEPRFLVAERPGFGDADDILDLEQLGGACPTCAYFGRPSRAPVGTLRRIIGGGVLQQIELDAIFVPGAFGAPVPGTWSSTDVIQPLGGPGTMQGCAP